MSARTLTLLALCALAACTPREPSRFSLRVRVESDPGQPLAAAQVALEGTLLGTTDERGETSFSLLGEPGEVLDLDVRCPSGFRSPERPLSVVLKALVERGTIPEYRVLCPPLTRSLVVAVRAQNGENLPLRYLGREIARTDADGACHALLQLPPSESVTLTLDTSAEDKLRPKSPEFKFTVPPQDEVLVFDQTFAREAEPKPAARRRRKAVGPVRL